MRHVSALPPTSSFIGILRNNAGAFARHRAARGPTSSTFAMSAAVDSSAWSATCIDVMLSTTGPPAAFAAFVAARMRRIRFRNDVKSFIIPALWPAIARTSHNEQSVGFDQSSGVSERSWSATRAYSVVARPCISWRVIAGIVSVVVAVIIVFAFPSQASSPSWSCARRTSRPRRRSAGSSDRRRDRSRSAGRRARCRAR